jgi:hypothetical protein
MTNENEQDTSVEQEAPPENVRTEEDVKREIAETLQSTVLEGQSTVKDFFVQYVSHAASIETEKVTVETCLNVLAAEFPEVMMPLAEGNFMFGYQTAMNDMLSTVAGVQEGVEEISEDGERIVNE